MGKKENALLGGTLLFCAKELIETGNVHEGIGMLMLCVLLVLHIFVLPCLHPSTWQQCLQDKRCFRKEESQGGKEENGIALGVVALPFVFAAQQSKFSHNFPDARKIFWLSLVCSFTSLFSLICHATLRMHSTGASIALGAVLSIGAVAFNEEQQWFPLVVATASCFSMLYYHLPRTMARSFTQGECVAVSTICSLLLVQSVSRWLNLAGLSAPLICGASHNIMLVSECLFVGCILIGVVVLGVQHSLSPRAFHLRVAAVVFGIIYPWMWISLSLEPLSWLAAAITSPAHIHIGSSFSFSRGLALLLFWVFCLVFGVVLAPASGVKKKHERSSALPLRPQEETTTRTSWIPNIVIRKYYHVLAVIMFVPSTILEAELMAVAYVGALTFLIVLEFFRIARVPPLGPVLHDFMVKYIDQRDAGRAILTHIYLLVGCALPLWLHLAAGRVHHEWNVIPGLAGIFVLGAGDSAASLVGSMWGRMRWPGSRKTIEGTLGAIGGMYALALITAVIFGHAFVGTRFLLASAFTCLLESFTSQIDNLFLPLYFYGMLLLLNQ